MSNEKINAIIRELRRSAETLTPGKRRDVNNKLDRITMALRNAEVRDEETDPSIEFERQRQIVYNYLLAGNTITSLEAIRKWGITRLSARIHIERIRVAEGHFHRARQNGSRSQVDRQRLVAVVRILGSRACSAYNIFLYRSASTETRSSGSRFIRRSRSRKRRPDMLNPPARSARATAPFRPNTPPAPPDARHSGKRRKP